MTSFGHRMVAGHSSSLVITRGARTRELGGARAHLIAPAEEEQATAKVGGSKEREPRVWTPVSYPASRSMPPMQKSIVSWNSILFLTHIQVPSPGRDAWGTGCCQGETWVDIRDYSVKSKGRSIETHHHSWQKDTQAQLIEDPSLSQSTNVHWLPLVTSQMPWEALGQREDGVSGLNELTAQ